MRDTMHSVTETRKAKAIILGLEHPRAVAAVHSLGRGGIPVIGVDHDPDAVGFVSRRLTSKFLIGREPEKALEFLESLGRDGGGVLIPTNDHCNILVSMNLDRLSGRRERGERGQGERGQSWLVVLGLSLQYLP